MTTYSFARLSILSAIALAGAGAANADVFLKTSLVGGDASQRGFEGQIEITGASMNVSSFVMPDPEAVEETVRSTTVGPIFITKSADRSSPKLMAAAVEGQPLGRVEITFTTPARPGSAPQVESRWIIEGAEVRSFSMNPDPSNGYAPMESLEISYSSMTYQYFPKDGRGGRSTTAEEAKWRVPDEQLFPLDAYCH